MGALDDLIARKSGGGGQALGSALDALIASKIQAAIPSTGVTIAPKGGMPRMATPQEAQPLRRASVLPLALNQNTGRVEPALPEFAEKMLTAPRRAFSGELPVQSADPITGEVHSSPEAIQEAANFSAVSPLAPGRGAMIAAAPQRAFRSTQPPRSTIPTTAELGDLARIAYKRAEDAGLAVKGESYGQMVRELEVKLASEGLHPKLHPKAFAAAEELIKAGETPKTLAELDRLRRIAKGAAASSEPDERRVAKVMVDRIDDFLAGLKPQDVLSGNAVVGSNSIREARSLWSRMRKSEIIDEAIEKAKNAVGANFTQAGFATALKQKFRGLLDNKKIMRQFTKEEQAAIRRVVRGGGVEKLVRLLSKMAPRGVVSGGFNLGVGAAFGGPFGFATALIGEGARQGATRMALRNVNRASDVVRRGPNLSSFLTEGR